MSEAMAASSIDIPAPVGASALAARLRRLSQPRGADPLVIEDGTLADYRAMSSHHYREGRPGVVSRVHRLVHAESKQLIGVLVLAMPVLNCRARDLATGGRLRGLSRREAARRVNEEFRTISRVIVHPQWRGLGLSVRLVRRALAEAPTRYVEAMAAMGRVHPFFERAGMRRFEPAPARAEARLREVLAALGLEPALLASRRALEARLASREDDARERLEAALRRWNTASCGRRRMKDHEVGWVELVAAARRRLAAAPVYFLAGPRR